MHRIISVMADGEQADGGLLPLVAQRGGRHGRLSHERDQAHALPSCVTRAKVLRGAARSTPFISSLHTLAQRVMSSATMSKGLTSGGASSVTLWHLYLLRLTEFSSCTVPRVVLFHHKIAHLLRVATEAALRPTPVLRCCAVEGRRAHNVMPQSSALSLGEQSPHCVPTLSRL